MNLHAQTVLYRHLRHFNQHVAVKPPCIVRAPSALFKALIYRMRVIKPLGMDRFNRVIGRGGAHLDEKGSPDAQGLKVTRITVQSDASYFLQLL